MPTVPRYDSSATPSAGRGPRVQSDGGFARVETSTDEVSRAANKLGDTVQNLIKDEQEKADQLASMENDKRLAELETSTQVEMQQLRGKDSAAAPDVVQTKWDKGLEEIRKGASNQRQRLFLEKSANARWQSLNKNVQFHVAGQMQEFDDNETKGYVATAKNAAVLNAHDDARVGLEIGRQRAAVTDWAKRKGIPVDSEQFKSKLTEVTSNTHRDVIGARLAADQDIKAKEYFERVKGELTGDDIEVVSKQLEEGSARGESQRIADDIMGKFKTWPERQAAVKEMTKTNPKVRDLVKNRIDDEMSTEQAVKSAQRNDLYLQATNDIDKNPGKSARQVVKANVWAQLSLDQRNALENRGGDPENDDKTWLDFLDMPASKVAALSRADFETKYWARFDKSHRQRAEAQWEASRAGADSPKLMATLSFKDRVDNVLRTTGVIDADKKKSDFSEDEAKTYAQFETLAAREVEVFQRTQLGGKREATGEEVQKIIEPLAVKRLFIKKDFARDPEKMTMLMTDEERGQAYMPLNKIPKPAVAEIENLLRSKGKKVSPSRVERLYGARVMEDRKLFEKILAE